MIQCLEKQLEESSMAYTEKDKELMALQKLKLEAENQTLKCVKTEKQLLIEEFCMSDIYADRRTGFFIPKISSFR